MLGKARLNWRQMVAVSEAFDGGDGTPRRRRQGHAGQTGLTVNEHRAAPTGAKIAASLDAQLTDIVPEDVEQNRIARRQHLNRAVVHLACQTVFGAWGSIGTRASPTIFAPLRGRAFTL